MQIHYFQRYHSKENVDTSNTMLMLSRLYNYNSDKFFSMLNSLILGQDESPEISFDLQVVGDESVPDAFISQKSLKIVVETKLYNQFSQEQLIKHLSQFGTEEIKVLLTLDPKPMKQALFDRFGTALKKYNSQKINTIKTPIKHVNLTFEQLVLAMEDIVDERDSEIVAGETIDDNLKYNFYYDQASRGCADHGYIGLYKGKSIRAIGKLIKTVVAEMIDGEVAYINERGVPATKDEIEKIKEAMMHAEADHGYNLKTVKHRYFIVDQFYEIDFRKTSKNPIQKSKFFNLAEMLKCKKLPETSQIAKELDGRTWEEFL